MGAAGASATPLLLKDFGLQSLSGCLPEGLLPAEWRPLCAELNSLDGRGNFAWAGGDDGYLIAGELRLQRLLLADRLDDDRGLLLQQLHTGEGYLRRNADGDNPWIERDRDSAVVAPVAAAPPVVDESGAEKGLLPEELARRNNDVGDEPAVAPATGAANIDSPNLKLNSASLSRLQGCLPRAWARLLYRANKEPQQMPTCFDLRNLRQHSPLVVAWQGGVDLSAAQLTLERAKADTEAGKTLLDLAGLRLPRARLRFLPLPYRSTFVALPQLSLEAFSACLPPAVESLALQIRCAELQGLRLGKNFQLAVDSRQVSADLSGTLAQRILLTEQGEQYIVDLQKLLTPQLAFHWPRRAGRPTRLRLHNLSAASLHACLPQETEMRAGLPRCISTEELRSVGDSGLALGETLFKAAPVAKPLWRIDGAQVEQLSMTADALELHGLDIRQLLVCGLKKLLPPNASAMGVADCATAELLEFSGVSRIGLSPSAPRIELGALEAEPVELWQEEEGTCPPACNT
ncbi:hypothetical protein [Microbulbifer taiwanensis]|uniref:hypothetical protein n=1 Tax=Microbulbifer taiwanensis TaxID=986746 RepID=UPI003618B4D1